MRHGSMFTGIEGFGLGLEMAGWDFQTVWQSDINEYCNNLNKARFPDVIQLGDITKVEEIPKVDVVTAGFPCQPASQAGKGLAQDDPRWLWPQVKRVVAQVQPTYLIAENVRGLRARGLADVLSDLAELGYDAQWDLVPAAAVGAPHLRHRFWIVAYHSDDKIGRIFHSPPPVYRWPDEAPSLPRLTGRMPDRRERLTALGNAVVPHSVCFVAERIAEAESEGYYPTLEVGVTVESFGGKPPYAGSLVDGYVYEAKTCAPALRKARLWPTAAANDADWGVEALAACVHVDGSPARDPHMRFYHPRTGQIVQRTLANYVRGVDAGLWEEPGEGRLWPTAAATDYKVVSSEGQRRGQLEEAVKVEEGFWPTATASDALGSRRATARTDEWTSNPGTTLLDKVWEVEDVDPSEVHGSSGATGKLLWPTPKGPSGNRNSRKALTQKKFSGVALEQAVEMADGELPREIDSLEELGGDAARFWPTPKASPSGPDFARVGRERSGGDDLATTVVKQERTSTSGTSLNPTWVEWLMGYPPDWTVRP